MNLDLGSQGNVIPRADVLGTCGDYTMGKSREVLELPADHAASGNMADDSEPQIAGDHAPKKPTPPAPPSSGHEETAEQQAARLFSLPGHPLDEEEEEDD